MYASDCGIDKRRARTLGCWDSDACMWYYEERLNEHVQLSLPHQTTPLTENTLVAITPKKNSGKLSVNEANDIIHVKSRSKKTR